MPKIIKVKENWYKVKTKKGLDLKIAGAPGQKISDGLPVTKVALLGNDYPGLRPSILVSVGDMVKLGQPLLTDRMKPAIQFTSPGAGKVIAVNRGEKRKFESVVIELAENAELTFEKYTSPELQKISRDETIKNLLNSGLWTSLRNRPFGYIADPHDIPHSIFVTAIDTNPHAANPVMFIEKHAEAFKTGLNVLQKLTKGKLYLIRKAGVSLPEVSDENSELNLVHIEAEGPHPAGNAGTHIHFFDPVGPHKNVWYLDSQDLIAIGHLFITGRILTERMVSISGPASINPSVVITRMGASTEELVSGRRKEGEVRVVSGSLLSGATASGSFAYLGRYHRQVSLIHEDRERKFLGWLSPGWRNFSLRRIYVSSFIKRSDYEFTTSTNGSKRPIIPIGVFEDVMPLDINPTYLLRTILMGDRENAESLGIFEFAEELGVLELEEEDLALCSFVSPGKEDFGFVLRSILDTLAKS